VRVIAPLVASVGVVAVVVVAAAAFDRGRSTDAVLPRTPRSLTAPVSSAPALRSPVSSAPVSSAQGLPPIAVPSTSSIFSPLQSPPQLLATPPTVAATWHDGGVAVLTASEAPGSSMIVGANDLVAVGATVLAATDQGVARSADSGATWRYVVTGVDLWSITRAGNGFVALGKRGGPDENGPAVIASSADGVTWQLVDPEVPQSTQAVVSFGYGQRIAATGVGAQAIDLALPDIAAGSVGGDTLRSVDGGRTWNTLSTSLNTGIDVLPDGVTMYATGSANADSCSGAVYRSTDAGAHWALLPSSCQDRALYAVTFVDAQHGFAAGGTPAKYNGSEIVEATDDGGRTWQVRWSTPLDPSTGTGYGVDNEIVRLVFADAQHGYALSGGCVDGQNGPCGGNLYVTSDAGYSWHAAGRDGLGVAAAGADVYLSGRPQDDNGASVLAISNDAGQQWTLHSSATQVSSQPVAGTGKKLWWQTELGTYTSSDAGKHWTPAAAGAISSLPMYADPLQAAPPGDLLTLDRSTGATWSSTDGATVHQSFPVGPNDSVDAVALGPDGRAAAIVGYNDDCSSPQLIAKMELAKPGWQPETRPATLYLSKDAGGRWNRAPTASLPFPFSAFAPGSLAMSSSLQVAMDACAHLEISSNDGTTWSTITAPNAGSGCTVSVFDKEIWLDCSASVAHSTDAGATWTTYTTNPSGVQQLSQPLQAIGPDTAIVSAAGSLWRTTDGGAHWTQTWPTLNGES
jgi:photosystem II stability/assembly factor-like uncharacterized protein